MFINISNHPSSKWGEPQLREAKTLAGDGNVLDLPFPNVPPEATELEVGEIARKTFSEMLNLVKGSEEADVVHLMGEQALCFFLTEILREEGFPVFVSTTKRAVVENKDGTKVSTFEFVKFRRIA